MVSAIPFTRSRQSIFQHVLWVGWCPHPSLHWTSHLTTGGGHSVSISATAQSLSYSQPHRLPGVSQISGFQLVPEMHRINFLSLFQPSLHPSFPTTDCHSYSTPHTLSYPVASLQPPLMTILFPILSEIQAYPLGPCLLLNFFGSIDCSMAILYLMANVHL